MRRRRNGPRPARSTSPYLEDGPSGLVHVGQVFGDELVERGGRGQRSGEGPHAGDLLQRAAFPRSPHEFGEDLQVATGHPRQLGEGVGGDRGVERPVEQSVELVGIQRLEVDADEVAVAIQAGEAGRRRPARAHGADEEHRSGHDEWNEHRHGRVVQQVEVVDEQDQAPVLGRPAELGAGGVEQRGSLVVTDSEVVDQFGREDVGERAERDALRGRMPDCSLDAPTGALGEAQGLLGESRLAHSGWAEHDDTTARPLAVERSQTLELDGPTCQRPRCGHPRTAAARGTALLPSQPISTGRDAT
jgi:hypothetical protein